MTAQTAPAMKSAGGPVTPVIVKSGGDDGSADTSVTPNTVSITSASINFAETVPGGTWASSQSTSTGRISNLNITDGSITTNVPVTPSSALASISVKFGLLTQLIAMESGVPELNNVVLLITSPEVPFHVTENATENGPESGQWTQSTTSFPQKIKNLTLMVGDEQHLFYEFQTDDVTLSITFE